MNMHCRDFSNYTIYYTYILYIYTYIHIYNYTFCWQVIGQDGTIYAEINDAQMRANTGKMTSPRMDSHRFINGVIYATVDHTSRIPSPPPKQFWANCTFNVLCYQETMNIWRIKLTLTFSFCLNTTVRSDPTHVFACDTLNIIVWWSFMIFSYLLTIRTDNAQGRTCS